jgi:diguanylate cyclase (GGDEF)-like protein
MEKKLIIHQKLKTKWNSMSKPPRWIPLEYWAESLSRFLHLFRLDTIKNRILVFAILATLAPAVTVGWLYYAYTKRFLQEKITEEMRNISSQAARELDLWFKERFYDIRVFAGSREVSENLEKILPTEGRPGEDQAIARLTDYLKFVIERFVDYDELMIFDLKGQLVATTDGETGTRSLPSTDWLSRAMEGKPVASDVFWDPVLKRAVMIIGVPIKDGSGRSSVLLGGKLNFGSINETVKRESYGKAGEVYLITRRGILVVTSMPVSLPFTEAKLESETTKALFEAAGLVVEFADYQRKNVVGVFEPSAMLDWGVVTAVKKELAYAQIAKLRALTVLVLSGLLLAVGITAYLLGLTILRPLDRLTKAASKVAEGNLEIDLPLVSRGEVGHMTEVFNSMVVNLRRSREELAAANKTLREKNKELEAISITDTLTGVSNRKHLMETLSHELARARRYGHRLSILMVDIDHFKRYNDTFGHLAGDRALAGMASIFKKSVRRIDYVARYGGEEFVIVFPETGFEEAVSAAERICTRVAGTSFSDLEQNATLTVSIGVSGFPEFGDTPESIIASADKALYQAKRRGRNRVVPAHDQAGKREITQRRLVH